ncbi:MAG: pilin [Patescibacteria group bacterium]
MLNHKSKFKILNFTLSFLILIFTFLIFSPVFALTDTTGPKNASDLPLVTCGVGEGKSFKACTICDIWVLANRVVNFLFYLATPILVIVLIVGGFIYLTSGGNPKKTESAKSLLSSAIFGIIIALASWLIVSTVLKNLAKEGNEFILPWHSLPTCPAPIPPEDVDLKKLGELMRKGGEPPTTETGELGTEAQAKKFFIDAGIQISSTGDCSDQQNPKCTSLIGYPATSATKLINILQIYSHNNKTDVIITGGTEEGHSENGDHGIGKTGIDLTPAVKSKVNYQILVDYINIIPGASARCESSPDAQRKVRIISDCGAGTTHVHATIPR